MRPENWNLFAPRIGASLSPDGKNGDSSRRGDVLHSQPTPFSRRGRVRRRSPTSRKPWCPRLITGLLCEYAQQSLSKRYRDAAEPQRELPVHSVGSNSDPLAYKERQVRLHVSVELLGATSAPGRDRFGCFVFGTARTPPFPGKPLHAARRSSGEPDHVHRASRCRTRLPIRFTGSSSRERSPSRPCSEGNCFCLSRSINRCSISAATWATRSTIRCR